MDIDLEREAFEKWAVDVLPPFKLSTITGLYSPDYVNSIFAGWQARAAMPLLAIPEGYALVPVEPTPEMLDVAVSFALNVTLSHENTWSAYMRNVWLRMTAASQQAAQ